MATPAPVFTFNDLKDILVKRIRLPESQIKNDPSMSFEALGLDSLALVELQLEVQQRYGFTIPDDDVRSITTIGQAIDYTNRRLQKAE
jgi:acyl carrier protein